MVCVKIRIEKLPRKKVKYKRCKECKELVIDVENCANCANRDESYSRKWVGQGKRGSPTLDIQEGNSEESF